MFGIWNDSAATDNEIKECKGDYIGCEICRYQEKCLKLKYNKIEEIEKEEK